MREKLAILLVFFATLMIFTSGMIPHHHHKDSLCIVMGKCINDLHHHSDSNNPADDDAMNHESHFCLSKSLFLAKPTKDVKQQKDCSCDNHKHLHILPVFVVYQLFIDETPVKKTETEEGAITYTSADIACTNGLRAPPCTLA